VVLSASHSQIGNNERARAKEEARIKIKKR